jgi:hypothetical protein
MTACEQVIDGGGGDTKVIAMKSSPSLGKFSLAGLRSLSTFYKWVMISLDKKELSCLKTSAEV